MAVDSLSVYSVLQALWHGYKDLWFARCKCCYLLRVLSLTAGWRKQKYTAYRHCQCAFESLKHRIFTLLSAWSDDTNTILYGLVITALFFIGTQSIIYHWQCSWGLMMHNSVGVVWHTAPAEGIWKVIRAINPKFFSVVCHDALQQPVVMTVPVCSCPLPLSVSSQKNNTTYFFKPPDDKVEFERTTSKFKAGNSF